MESNKSSSPWGEKNANYSKQGDENYAMNEKPKVPPLSTDPLSLNVPTKLSKYMWIDLANILRKNERLRRLLLDNLELLNVSEETFRRIKLPNSELRTTVEYFGNQNCIRALSVIEDLSGLKKNQYKFMYEKLTLAAAIDLAISESCFLHKSLQKHKTAPKHFVRLVRSWIDYIFIVHKVPEDAREQLAHNILLQVEHISNNSLL